jgi:2-dehydropantoate 2-reductase
VRASDDPALLEDCDAVMLACKMPDLDAMLARLAPQLAPHALLLTLQNGVDASGMTAEMFPEHIVAAGTAFIGARIEAPGHVLHTAAGGIRAGIWQDVGKPDAPSRLDALLAALNEAGVPAREERDVRRMLWRKLLWNCGFNALTAIVRRHARDVAAHPETRAIIEAAMRETIAVARAQGVALTEEDADKHMAVTLAMGPVKTSMWQDVERGRPTEVDWINGAVVRRAEESGLDAPVNRMLVALVHALEGGNEVRG